MQSTVRLAALVCVVVLSSAQAILAAPARNVQIRWDFRQETPKQLQIWTDCTKVSGDLTTCEDPGHTVTGVDAYHFELKRNDKVTLVVVADKSGGPGSAEYAITGKNLDDKDLDQLKKLLAATGGATAASSRTSAPVQQQSQLPDPAVYVKAVTDSLIAGGKLTATFNLKTKDGTGKETVTQTSGSLTFTIQPESPRITVSAGIGFSTAPNPTVALVKTSTIVSFTNEGKQQQAYQQVITLKDTDTKLHPVQSLMTVANFRLYQRVYASAGIRVDEKIFEQPVIGVTYRHPLGDRVGVNFTLGTLFSRETEILQESGFSSGQTIDPTIGLTADDIPTRTRYHRRVGILITMDF